MDNAPSIQLFISNWSFFKDAVLTSTVLGATLGVLGVYVLMRQLFFLSSVLTAVASFGVVIYFYLAAFVVLPIIFSPTLFAIVFCILYLIWMSRKEKTLRSKESVTSLLAWMYLFYSGLTLVSSAHLAEGMHDIQIVLSGSAVTVFPEHYKLALWCSASVLLLHFFLWPSFVLCSIDPMGARVRKLPVRTLNILLYGSLAITVALSTRLLGGLPAFAFSVLPAMAARPLISGVGRGLLLSACLGAIMGFLGYFLAFLYELPVGATQTVVGGCMVFISQWFTQMRGRSYLP